MIEEQTKTITEEALSKMKEGNQYLIIPSSAMDIELPMADMSDGLGGYHSLNSLKETFTGSWKETKLSDDLVFVHYCFDEDDEKQQLAEAFALLGLATIRNNKKVTELIKEDFIANGWMICSSREIKIVQQLMAVEEI